MVGCHIRWPPTPTLHHLHHFPPLVLRAWSSGPLRDGDWPASAPVPTCMRCLHRCMVALSSRSAPLLRTGMQQCSRDRTRAAVTRMKFWSCDFWSHSCLVGRCDGQERMGRPRCRCHQDSRGCGRVGWGLLPGKGCQTQDALSL
jgi:hypothetical protein